MNFKEIIEAWTISFKPSPEQKLLAEKRGEICDECPSKIPNNKLFKFPVCKECGCPIGKKIFTNEINPCPLKKWEDIDVEYFNKFNKNKSKKNKLL